MGWDANVATSVGVGAGVTGDCAGVRKGSIYVVPLPGRKLGGTVETVVAEVAAIR